MDDMSKSALDLTVIDLAWRVRETIEAVGAKLLYLPPCPPDLNPI